MLTRQEQLDRIWQRTPVHRRGVMDGLRIILEQKDRGTVPVFLGNLTDAQIADMLDAAQGVATC